MFEILGVLALVAAIVAYRRVSRVRAEVTALRDEVAQLKLRSILAPITAGEAASTPAPAATPEPGPAELAVPATPPPVASPLPQVAGAAALVGPATGQA